MYVCSPGNPTGKVLSLDDWKQLFALSDKYGFVIAADEMLFGTFLRRKQAADRRAAGGEAARPQQRASGHVLQPLKRSNVPGMRSGFVAGDAAILKQFLLYRTYHGAAMSPAVQAASVAAWNDEAHVIENRRLYVESLRRSRRSSSSVLQTGMPDAGFYLWARAAGFPTPNSPAGCSLNIMWWCCRAASSPARPTGEPRRRIRAHRARCPRSPKRSKPPIASNNSFQNSRKNNMQQFQQIIEEAWENRTTLQPGTAPTKVGRSRHRRARELDAGRLALPRRSTATGSPSSGSRRRCCFPSASRTTA